MPSAALNWSSGLLYAISANDPAEVSALLKHGADPNSQIRITSKMDGIAGLSCAAKKEYDTYGRERSVMLDFDTTPMHIAVSSAFKAMTLVDADTDDAGALAVESSLEIIDALLANGAHTTQKASLRVELKGAIVDMESVDAYDVAYCLRYRMGWRHHPAAAKLQSKIVAIRVSHARATNDEDVKNKKRRVDCGPGKALRVDALAPFHTLLHDSSHADVVFECTDNVEFPAHKAICAAKSPYFSGVFSRLLPGVLRDVVPVATSSHVMQHVKDHVYTGSLPSADDLGEYTTDVLVAASNFLLPDLAVHCFELGAETVSPAMFKTLLVLASAHDAMKRLKDALFKLARKEPSAVLANAKVPALATESPELWAELVSSLRPSDPASNVVVSDAH